MMLERHYDEESLIALLHSGEGAAGRDPHLSACASCADMLESYRVISEVLGDKAVWELHDTSNDEASARSAAKLRSFVAEMESEDREALLLVEQLAKSPRQWWVATVERDERYQTAGVMRRLIEVSEVKIDTMPPEAIEAAAAAIAIGDVLDIPLLQVSALRQYAYALYYTGAFKQALAALDRADAAAKFITVDEYSIARLNIVRALVYRKFERFSEAIELARSSTRTFRAFGDSQRLSSALMAEAQILIEQRKYREALPILSAIYREMADVVTLDTQARALQSMAFCQRELGDIADALQSFQLAAMLYDELGTLAESARIRYSIARMIVAQGNHVEGKKRLLEVRTELEHLGMVDTAVVAGLDLAELAVIDGNFREVEELCRNAMRQFEVSGVAHSSEALTALTFLREAAEQRRATQEIVWHVRTYIKRLPDEPALLFAPAPFPAT